MAWEGERKHRFYPFYPINTEFYFFLGGKLYIIAKNNVYLWEIAYLMNKITEIMKSYHGRFVPMFHWSNHTPMKIWYNEQTNTICVDCGVSKMLPDDIEKF